MLIFNKWNINLKKPNKPLWYILPLSLLLFFILIILTQPSIIFKQNTTINHETTKLPAIKIKNSGELANKISVKKEYESKQTISPKAKPISNQENNLPAIKNIQENTKPISKLESVEKKINLQNNASKKDQESGKKDCDVKTLGTTSCIISIITGPNELTWLGKQTNIDTIINTENIYIKNFEKNSSIEDIKKAIIQETTLWYKNNKTNIWSSWNTHNTKNNPLLKNIQYKKNYILVAKRNFQIELIIDPITIPPNLSNTRIVSYYGYPEEPRLGILGKYDEDKLVHEMNKLVNQWQLLSVDLKVVGAFHIIVAVAQDQPMEDGTYLDRIPRDLLSKYVELAKKNNFLVYLDIQIGWANILSEMNIIKDFLKMEHVHLALDPEYATQQQQTVPGKVIGFIDENHINSTQEFLNQFNIFGIDYKKTLMIHQFNRFMIQNSSKIKNYENIELAIDMDGFGGKEGKINNYELFSLSDYSEIPTIKLFYEWDEPLLSIEELLNLPIAPKIIIYQ